ncbi:cobalamin binding intrinsic factor-like [Polyodon spathula]|uniref:cobalamin binding intrinsic factor-like n=1 Tax=Polyodon spathula TaxID=7913 RepID=UPI001B7E7BD2|nr:cobalamin binding intrinsic factor-like [Polyodon spathula]
MNCSTTIETVLNQARNGFFNNSMAASQITPSLENRNYLELNKLDCNNVTSPPQSPPPTRVALDPHERNLDSLDCCFLCPGHLPGTMLPPTTSEKEIIVHYKVENNITEKHFNFAINVTVHEGSTLLQVMEEAKRKNPSNFSFTVEESSWGPFVTSIHGLYGNQETRTYWQFLSGKTPLDQGIDFYELKNNEDIVAEFSKY